MAIINGTKYLHTLNGSAADDTITALDGDNTVNAGDGFNVVVTGAGNDRITAGSGDDKIDAGAGTNVINAGDGNNSVTAGNGNNSVTTGKGMDVIVTGSGNDVISSGAGDDFVNSGSGSDFVLLGAGNDTVQYDVSGGILGKTLLYGDTGADTLQLLLNPAQFANSAIQADIARFNATSGGGIQGFTFGTLGVLTSGIEKVVIVGPVDAIDDAATVGEDGSVSFNVLSNDLDTGAADKSALHVLSYDASNLGGGALTTNSNGGFTFTPGAAFQALAANESKTVSFSYVLADNQGFTDTATATIVVNGANDAPVVSGAVTGTATEDGASVTLDALANASDVDHGSVLSVALTTDPLPAGVSYDAATHSFTLDPTASAYQALAAGETTTVTVNYGVSDGTASTAGSVSWTVSGINDAPVVTAQSAMTQEDAAPSTIDALAGASDVDHNASLSVVGIGTLPAGVSYDATTHSFTLDPGNAAFQSLQQGQPQQVTVNYSVSDGIAAPVATSATWTVTGVNDPPVANPVDGRVAGGSAQVNLMLILDLSGSMNDVVSSGTTRLDSAKTALVNLINQYDGRGDVAVRLVTFSTSGVDNGGHWLTAAEAKAEIASFKPTDGTVYDVALLQARDAFMSGEGRLTNGQNVSYFVSDGVPNSALTTAQEKSWTDFLGANKINSYALGIGSDLSSSSLTYLNPVAYNGITKTQANANLVTNVNQLSSVLVATVNTAVSGNLLTGASPQGSFGPDDGGYVGAIFVEGTTFRFNGSSVVQSSGTVRAYTWDAATHLLQTTDRTGGTLTVNLLTADYTFVPSGQLGLGTPSQVGFTLKDYFGASASSTLNLSNDGVRDDHVLTNSNGPVSFSTAALLANDIDSSGQPVTFGSIKSVVGGTVSVGGGSIAFTPDAAATSASFVYTGFGVLVNGYNSDTATVTIDRGQAGLSTLTGSANDDILIGDPTRATTFTGGAGNDQIRGGTAADTYVFGVNDGYDQITDAATGNALRFTGTGDLGGFDLRAAKLISTSTTASDLVFTVGHTDVVVAAADTSAVIRSVSFDAGATIYGAALAQTYGLAGTAGVTGAGNIYRPSPNTSTGSGVPAPITVTGTAYADILIDNGNANTLFGGAGNDILIGKGGNDQLTGGAGADTFVFQSASDGHSLFYAATQVYDRITDFEHGSDKISLMAIDADTSLAGDQAFTFVANATSAVQAHSITWTQVDANTVMLRIDTNGDTTADLMIQVHSTTAFTPTASDFIL